MPRLPTRKLLYIVAPLLLVLPIVAIFYWPAKGGLDVWGHQIGRDFINVWAGPQLAFGGHIDVLFDLSGYRTAIGELFGQPLPFHNWSYPLYVLPLFWPLAQLPYFAALAVWTAGLFAVFAAVVLSQIAREQRAFGLVLLAVAPASLVNILAGQNGFLTASLLLGGMLTLEPRPLLAGVLLGLLTCKPQLAIVVPSVLLALGAWRTIAAAAATTLAMAGLSLLLFGFEPWRQYFEVVGAFQFHLLAAFKGFYTLMMTSTVAAGRLMGGSYPVMMVIQIVLALAVVAATCWTVRRMGDPCWRAFVVACAAPLITPYAFNYDLTALSAGLVWILCGRLPWRADAAVLCFFAWITPLVVMYAAFAGIGFAPAVLLALFVFTVREAIRPPDLPLGYANPASAAA